MNRHIKPIVLALVAIFALAACSNGGGSAATRQEAAVADAQLDTFSKAQPVPLFNWSQLRQNLIEVETAQANTTATTSFFFNQGVQEPVASCPSIGFPIPSTYQLTNPDKVVTNGGNDSRSGTAIPQLEANGVYTADSTGTYVVCIDSNGAGYAFYWEGFVSTVTGPATWDSTKHSVVLTGDPTGAFSTSK